MTSDPLVTGSVRWRLNTPSRAGAIALVELVGEDGLALDAALRVIGLSGIKPGDVQLRSLAGVDRGLVARWSDELIHLMPHGGSAVVRALVEALSERGIAQADDQSGEPSNKSDVRRSYPEGADEIESYMLEALSRAQSPLAVDLLLRQPAQWRGYEGDDAAPAELDRLIDPPLVVVRGAANVGKSTLVNAIAGRAVSVVADEPGTTRDHVGVLVDMAGLVVRLLDMPGEREWAPEIEREAMAIAADLAREADLTIWCGDQERSPAEAGPAEGVGERLMVALKADLGPCSWPSDHAVAALNRQGMVDLVASIRDRLVPAVAMADPRPWRFWKGPMEPG